MLLNESDILELKRYCQSIINNPRPMEDQHHVRAGIHLWCRDWEIIEICKCLFNGESAYRLDPPPNRLKKNPLWNQEDIIVTARVILDSSNNVEEILGILKQRRQDGSP